MDVNVMLEKNAGRYVARCLDFALEADGATRELALEALREGVRDRFHVEAVAPPPNDARLEIALHVVEENPASELTETGERRRVRDSASG